MTTKPQWTAKINWDKVWEIFEEIIVQDVNEGKTGSIQEHREFIEMIVEKQLKKAKK